MKEFQPADSNIIRLDCENCHMVGVPESRPNVALVPVTGGAGLPVVSI